tara:strand:+ start:313 stop:1899 length:1587 start_codon:yes stop_codon:yes gene_type:complete
MNWKNRQMFGGRPSGIVQMMGGGMTPYPTHVMPDGTVMPGAVHGQGYEEGGLTGAAEPSIEERVAMIAAQQGIDVPTARAQLLQKTAADQGLQLPAETIKQFAVGMINLQAALAQGTPTMQTGSMGAMAMQQPNAQIQMQTGGMVGAELFEEGDSDINNALNTMASVSNPEVPDMPASAPTNDGLMIEKTMTMDQGSDYENDVMRLKEDFKNEIRSYASESGKEGLGKYLKNMDMTYSNALNALKKNYEVETVSPSESLLNEEFLQEIILIAEQGEIPKMQGGGLIESIVTQEDLTQQGITIPLELWLTLPDSAKKAQLLNAYAKKEFEGEMGTDTYSADMKKLVEQGEALIPEIGLAAGSAYKTKEGGTGGFIGQLMASKAGKAKAKQQLISDQINALSGNRSRTGSGKYESTAAIRNAMAGIEGKPDTSIFKSQVAAYNLQEDGAGLPLAIGNDAEVGLLPPKTGSLLIYHQTSKAGQTWPQFMLTYKKAWLAEQAKDGDTNATATGNSDFYRAAMLKWSQTIASK